MMSTRFIGRPSLPKMNRGRGRCEEIDNDDVCKRRRLRDADPCIAVGSRDDVQPVLPQSCRSGTSKHRVIFYDEDAAAVPHDETPR
jgi:hypothetical protein